MSLNKRVFVSHAGDDKERFVLRFALALHERGIEAWIDQWEMLPGDSLAKKIFGALDEVDAVVVVLSESSLTKPWVEEELDAAVVQRINTGSRLIPIVLDGLAIDRLPPSIRHLVHVRVADLDQVDDVADRVVRTVHGDADKPPVGSTPGFASMSARKIRGLDRIDSLILKMLGDEAVDDWATHFRTPDIVRSATAELGCSDDDVFDSLDVLDAARFIKIDRKTGPRPGSMGSFLLTRSGLETYARSYVEGYDEVGKRLLSCLANWPAESGTIGELADRAGAPGVLAEHLVEGYSRRGLVTLSRGLGGGPQRRHFTGLSVQLRRLAS